MEIGVAVKHSESSKNSASVITHLFTNKAPWATFGTQKLVCSCCVAPWTVYYFKYTHGSEGNEKQIASCIIKWKLITNYSSQQNTGLSH